MRPERCRICAAPRRAKRALPPGGAPPLRGWGGAAARAGGGGAGVPAERRPRFAVMVAAVRLYEGRVRGDPEQALQAARELLGRHPVFEGDVVAGELRSLALANLGIAELWAGELEAAARHLE